MMRLTLCLALASSLLAEDGLSEEALARVQEATVLVEVWYRELGGEDEIGPAVGSGFVVSEDGLVVTNRHVVAPVYVYDPHEGQEVAEAERAAERRVFVRASVKVRLRSGTERSRQLDAQVLATRDDPHDLALLRTRPGAPLTAFPVGDAIHDPTLDPPLRPTQRVWAVGFPLGHEVEDGLERLQMEKNPRGLDLSIREGSLSSLRKDDQGLVKALEHTCLIDHGNSGGPLVDVQGRVVGVNTWGYGKVGYAIPMAAVLGEFPDALRLRGHTAIAEKAAGRRTLVVEPAGKRTETTFQDLAEALAAARPGDEVVLPEGEITSTVSVTLPAGVRLRGAGVGRTKLVLPEQGKMTVGSMGYSELSDVTLDFQIGFGQLEVLGHSGAETFVHDVKVDSGVPRLAVGESALASLVEVELSGTFIEERADLDLFGPEGAPRLERCHFGYARVRSGARLLGCEGYGGILVQEEADPLVEGCSFHGAMSGERGRIRVDGAGGTYRFNSLTTGHGPAAEVCLSSRVRLEGNVISASQMGGGLVVEGEAEIAGNRFDVRVGPAVVVKGRADVRGNVIEFRGYSGLQVVDLMPDSFASFKEGYVYGVGVYGTEASASCAGNRFITWKDWGVAWRGHEGASDPADEGGNTVLQQEPTPGAGPEPK